MFKKKKIQHDWGSKRHIKDLSAPNCEGYERFDVLLIYAT